MKMIFICIFAFMQCDAVEGKTNQHKASSLSKSVKLCAEIVNSASDTLWRKDSIDCTYSIVITASNGCIIIERIQGDVKQLTIHLLYMNAKYNNKREASFARGSIRYNKSDMIKYLERYPEIAEDVLNCNTVAESVLLINALMSADEEVDMLTNKDIGIIKHAVFIQYRSKTQGLVRMKKEYK